MSLLQRINIHVFLFVGLFSSLEVCARDNVRNDSVYDSRHTVSIGFGLVAENKQFMDDLFDNGTLGDVYYVYHYNFSDMVTTNAINLNYTFNINKRFSIGCYTSFQTDSKNIFENSTDKKMGSARQTFLSLTPKFYVFWLNQGLFRIYSAAGVSVGFNWRKYSFGGTDFSGKQFERKPQLTLVGVKVGKKVYGFGEANIGGRLGYLNIGVGYRFGRLKKH